MSENRLKYETSPYLLQHADNPVHWRAWNADAFQEAIRRDKPVLLSVGYAACHWCHVMAHESFEDPAIAALMNDLFVPIKLDREERPDIDHIYQAALALLGQPGGWPLTMFLTPQGEPFWGGTYFPAKAGFGRPGFAEVLTKISDIYQSDQSLVGENSTAILNHLQDMQKPKVATALPEGYCDQVAEKLLSHVDMRHGGIGGAPKFPQVPIFELFWRAFIRGGESRYKDAVTTALDHMATGGIHDHLGGGFSRYSVDARWHAPHFEKMLYDNAQLVELYTLVWKETGKPLYAGRVAGVMEWLAREMMTDGGAFAAALDADSEGAEGRFYVWSKADIDALLPPADAALFCSVYGVSATGNWEDGNILHRLDSMETLGDSEEANLAQSRAILFRERETRIRPQRDDKALADWNGLMIRAAVRAGLCFDRPDWIDLAATAFAFIQNHMTGPDGRVWHSHCGGRLQKTALLDDHVHMIHAALTLHDATQRAAYRDQAILWAERVEALFLDEDNGGYFTTASDAEALILRIRTVHDTAVPSANGRLLEAFILLWHLTGEARWRTRIERQIKAFSGEAARSIFPLAAFFNGYDSLFQMVETTLQGDGDDPRLQALRAAHQAVSLPTSLLRIVGSADSLPEGHLGRDVAALDGAAIVCAQQRCSLPLRDPAALTSSLRKARGKAE